MKPLHLFWLVVFVAHTAFAVSLFTNSKEEIVYDQDVQIIDTVLPPETVKEKVVAEVKHEELKGPNYIIRVGYDGARKPIPKITGETVDERAKQLLDTVGLGHTLPTWKALGDKYGIEYTFAISIAWSDSHLGKALKSKNNLGNIGNNDRGDVKHFETLDAGIEAIFWSLAKGKYMSGHTTIGTLSGEGRKRLGLPGCSEEKDYRKKCYATSMGVWSTNTTNIMSVLHNKQIDESYSFRI